MVARTADQPSIQPMAQPAKNGVNGVADYGTACATDYAAAPNVSFPYGWRTVPETLPNGETIYRDIPLTPEDYLDPQLGDHMVQSDPHLILVVSLYNGFKKKYRNDPSTGVFSDLKMFWDQPGLKEPAPDLAVVPNLKQKKTNRPSFSVKEEGTRPCLIVEVVSPSYPGDDTVKVEVYEQVGIAEYIIINPHFENETTPLEITGYRLVDGLYQPIQPDAQGRLLSETTNVWFEMDENQRLLRLINDSTGEPLLDDEEEYEARLDAEARAAEAAQRAEAEAQRAAAAEAEIARLKGLLAQKSEGP